MHRFGRQVLLDNVKLWGQVLVESQGKVLVLGDQLRGWLPRVVVRLLDGTLNRVPQTLRVFIRLLYISCSIKRRYIISCLSLE